MAKSGSLGPSEGLHEVLYRSWGGSELEWIEHRPRVLSPLAFTVEQTRMGKKGTRKPTKPRDLDEVRDTPDRCEDAELTSVDENHTTNTRNRRERPALSSDEEEEDDHFSDPKSFEPVPAAAATPPAKARAPWKLPSLEDASLGPAEIPVYYAIPTEASNARDEVHYRHDDELVVLQVEDALFRVIASSLEASPSFSHLLAQRASRRAAPIKLPDVTVSEMDCFLRLLNARILYNDSLDFDVKELTSILRLSTGWEFSTARDWAIQKLSKVSQPAMKRLELAHIYCVKEWLEPAYFDLCARSTELSAEEIGQLIDLIEIAGLQVLLELREDYQRKKGPGRGFAANLLRQMSMQLEVDALKARIKLSAALGLRPGI